MVMVSKGVCRNFVLFAVMVLMGLLAARDEAAAPAASTSQPATRARGRGGPPRPFARAPAVRPNGNGPMVFVLGDSTVHNTGRILGWGDLIGDLDFDTKRMGVENHAQPGSSTRSFIQDGRWEVVRKQLQKGDFVLMQFGHNDPEGSLTANRFTLPGVGEETREDSYTGVPLMVHTFGFYMRQMISDAQAAGATPIVLSPIPRNSWANGKIKRGEQGTGDWAKTVAGAKNASFVDLNGIIADRYDPVPPAVIKALYFPQDNTHTNPAGAKVNASCVILGILALPDDHGLHAFLKEGAAEMAAAGAVVPHEAPASAPATVPAR